MKDDFDVPTPLPVSTPSNFEEAQSLDWVAPEDDSRARMVVFKFLPILFLCFFAYWPAWHGSDFVWQDDVQVTSNNPLKSPTGLGMVWIAPSVTPHWAPLSYSILWPQSFIWRDRTPLGYHLVSIFLHTINAMLVWTLLRRLELPGAFLVALIFALHPLQVEAVAWIARQPLLIGTMCSLCFMIVFWRWSKLDPTIPNPSRIFHLPEGPKKLYALVVFTLLMAILSGPIAACTLPLVMAVVVWWKREELTRRDVMGLIPLVLLSIVAVVFNAFVEHRHINAKWDWSFLESILIAARGTWFYVSKFFWPKSLTVAHRNWIVSLNDLAAWFILICSVVVGATLWARRRSIGRMPIAAVAIYLLLLLPMLSPLNRVAMHMSLVSERFQYLAGTVLAAAVIGAIAAIFRPIVRHERWPAPLAAALLVIVLTFAVFFGHANSFASPVALWENTANADEGNTEALIHLAQVYETQKDGVPKALDIYQRVLRYTDRRNIEALLGLGKLVEKQGDLDEAMRYYREALAAAPDRPEPYRQVGPLLLRQKKVDEALAFYQDAISRFPQDDILFHYLARAQAGKGDIDIALATLKKSAALNEYESSTRIDMAVLYFKKNDFPNARTELEKAFKLDPRNYELYMIVGQLSFIGNDLDSAVRYYHIASFLRPTQPEPLSNLGFVLTKQSWNYWQQGQAQIAKNKVGEALVYFQKAIDLSPDFAGAKERIQFAQNLQMRYQSTRPPVRPSSQPSGPASKPTTSPDVEK